jgi:hypothetical protein
MHRSTGLWILAVLVVVAGLFAGGANAHAQSAVAVPVTPPGQLVSNGTFASGLAGWTTSSAGNTISANGESRDGRPSLQLCGAANCDDEASQTVTVPAAGNQILLTYWYTITT